MITNRTYSLAVSTAGLILLAACSSQPPEPVLTDATRMKLSRALEAQGDYASAASVLRDPTAEPQRPASGPDLNRVMSLIQLGEVDQAMSVLRSELAVRSDDTPFALGAARIAAGAGRPAVAGEIYRGVLSKHPSDVDAMVGDGVIRAQTGDLPGAIAEFRQALARRPSDLAAKNNLDLALSMNGTKPAASVAVAAPTLAVAPVVAQAEPLPAPVVVVAPASSARAVPPTLAPTPLVVAEPVAPAPTLTPPSVTAALTKLQVAANAAPETSGGLGWTGQPVAGPSAFEEADQKPARKDRASRRQELVPDPVSNEPDGPSKVAQKDAVVEPVPLRASVGVSLPAPSTKTSGEVKPVNAPSGEKLGWTGASSQPEAPASEGGSTGNPKLQPGVGQEGVAPPDTFRESRRPSDGPVAVQLGAFPTERDAQAFWDKLRSAHPDQLDAMEPRYTQVVVRGQTYWRLRVGSFAGGPEARSFCTPLRVAGSACIEAF